ncbi:MAG: sugar ABC transporter substrate-binding protein, partial [Chloroflexota bacterium]|nr:sugar ABC transporter substrate-binding protein [Chloroflexota bacterium]
PPTGESPPAESPGAGQEQGVDDGTQLTMWTRAATEERATALVNAYNETHENKIQLRVVPTDEYVGVVGSAATANELPDLFSADVVFMPNWTSAGLFTDLTAQIDALPFIENVGQAHINASTWEGKKYGLPFIIDLSVWMYNKALFREANLDPEAPPQNLQEFADAARAVQALDRDGVYGTFWGGACGGCNVFTWWPISWAEGDPIMNEDGTESLNNSETMKTIYRTFGALWDEGVIHPESQQEAGPTWTAYFPQGTIGIMPMPASLQEIAGEGIADEDVGVTPIKGTTGGQSTFVGGDSIGISKDSQNVDQAWNFISWMLGDFAQVEVVAQGGNVVARTDLADNQYAAQDPRLVIFNEIAGEGETPLARNFFAAYNDPQSPWIQLFQAAVFQDASDEQIDQLNDQITQVLQAQ